MAICEMDRYQKIEQPSLARVLNACQEPIVLADWRGLITHWNLAAEKAFGYKPEELIGQPLRRIIPCEGLDEEQLHKGAVLKDTYFAAHGGKRIPCDITISPIQGDVGEINGLLTVLREPTKPARAVEALTEAMHRINTELDLSSALETVVENGLKVLEADRAAIFLIDEDEKVNSVYFKGISPEYVAEINRRYREFPGGQLLFAHEPILVLDAQSDPRTSAFRDFMKREGFRTYAVFPLNYRQQLIGAMVFYHDDISQYDDARLKLAQAFANQAAIAIENAKLFEDLGQSKRTLEALNEAAISVQRVLEEDRVFRVVGEELKKTGLVSAIALFDDDGKTARFVHFSQSSHVLKNARRLMGLRCKSCTFSIKKIPDLVFLTEQKKAILHRDRRSFVEQFLPARLKKLAGPLADLLQVGVVISSPLIFRDEVMGILYVSGDRLSPKDKPTIAAFANQVATSIENAKLFNSLDKHKENLRRLSERLLAVQEEERKRISRDLHDEVGQALSAMEINLNLLRRKVPANEEEVQKELGRAISLVEQTLEFTRRLSLDLRPSMLDDLGLIPTLRWYIDEFSQRSHLKAEFRADSLDGLLDKEAETAIYRIIQEALTNVVRHAQANEVSVKLMQRGGIVRLTVRDDGIGFDHQTTHRGGLGLLGIRERAILLGGELRIESHPGKGTSILVVLPLEGSEKNG